MRMKNSIGRPKASPPFLAILHNQSQRFSSSRKIEKKKSMNEISRRNKRLIDDIMATERSLQEAKHSISENRLELLKDQYFELIKAKCPQWMQEIEAQCKEVSSSYD